MTIIQIFNIRPRGKFDSRREITQKFGIPILQNCTKFVAPSLVFLPLRVRYYHSRFQPPTECQHTPRSPTLSSRSHKNERFIRIELSARKQAPVINVASCTCLPFMSRVI